MHRARIGIVLGPLTPVLAKQLGLDAGHQGNPGGRGRARQPRRQGGPQAGRRDRRLRRRARSGAVPTFRLRCRPAPSASRSTSSTIRDGQPQTATITPAPAENVVFDRERELRQDRESPAGGTGQDGHQRLRPRSSAVDCRAGQVARAAGERPRVLLVSNVKEGSSAEAEGIKEGDVITKVVRDRGIQPVTSVKDSRTWPPSPRARRSTCSRARARDGSRP